MEYVTIPGTDMKVTRVVLGTWAIGGWMWGGTDVDQSVRTIHAALDKGLNIVDTAPVYGFGKSEEIVGKAIEEWNRPRSEVHISTKVTLDWKDGQVFRNGTRERIHKEIDDSLRRLRTDYVDVYYVHWPDPLTPIQETAAAMREVLKSGKARAIGVSNFSPEQMEEFMEESPLSLCQPPYNIFERAIEDDVKPFCKSHDIALMTYGALCRGLLSGKMSQDTTFEGDDLRKSDPKFQEGRFGQYLDAVDRLKKLAEERFDKHVLPFAVRWILDQGVETALWGARHPDQMDALPEVFGWSLDQQAMAEVNEILDKAVHDPVGPEFMAPPDRSKI